MTELESKLVKLSEEILSYQDGYFKNMAGDNEDGWQTLDREFPEYKNLVKEYVDITCIQGGDTSGIPLPPFVVFPMYSSTTIGWRMGVGEQYEGVWMNVMKKLSDSELIDYCSKFEYPTWWIEANPYKEFVPPRYLFFPWKKA